MIETELLRAELERSFELEELFHLSRDLLGFDPEQVGGTAAKASFAGALASYSSEQDAVEALCDAILALRPDASPELSRIRANGFDRDGLLPAGSSFGPFLVGEKLGRVARQSPITPRSGAASTDCASSAPRPRRPPRPAAFLTMNLDSRIEHELYERIEAVELADALSGARSRWRETLAARVARTGPST